MSKGRSTQVEKTTVPKWQEDAFKELYAAGREGRDFEFVPYEGNPVANLTDDDLAGFANLRNYANQANRYDPLNTLNTIGNANPMLDTAYGSGVNINAPTIGASVDRNNIRNLSGGSLLSLQPGYQNQFTNDVINRAIDDNERARQIALIADEDAAIAAGAFGGSREGVQKSLTSAEYLRNMGDQAANLRLAGYDNAMNYAGEDLNRGLEANKYNQGYDFDTANNNAGYALQGQGLLSDLAMGQAGYDQSYADAVNQVNANNQDVRNAYYNRNVDIQGGLYDARNLANQGLLDIGTTNRGLAQDRINFNLGEFDRERNQFAQNLAMMTGAYSGVPTLPTTTTTKSQKMGFGDVLGGAAGLFGSLATGGAFGANGAAAGGISGLFR